MAMSLPLHKLMVRSWPRRLREQLPEMPVLAAPVLVQLMLPGQKCL